MTEVSNRSVGRALEIVRLLSAASSPLGLKDIADALSLPRSSTLTLLRSLREYDFVSIDDQGRYSIGVGCFEAGAAYARSMTPAKAAEDELRTLTATYGITSHFAILEGADVVYVAKQDPPNLGLRLASSIGARLPATGTAVGKAQLAFTQIPDSLLPLPATVDAELELTRSRGFALDEGETAFGIRCIAAPVFSDRGCVGAVGVSYLQQSDLDMTIIARSVLDVADAVTARLGGRPLARGAA
jgi:DNA-binding IclR family transcriptional regulator